MNQRLLISHAGRDLAWATWIAQQLSDAGFSPELGHWDWAAGKDRLVELSEAMRRAERIVPLFSTAYFAPDESDVRQWSAALLLNGGGASKLLPVRLEDVAPPALLGPLITVDLFGVDGDEARWRLLDAARGGSGRRRGSAPFPGASGAGNNGAAAPPPLHPRAVSGGAGGRPPTGNRTGRHEAARPQVARPQAARPETDRHRVGRSMPHVLAVATEWSSAHGGLSTFNRNLCVALSVAGARVSCLVPDATEEERRAAAAGGVTLVETARTPAAPGDARLFGAVDLDGDVPDIVIGHGRITGPAAHHHQARFDGARRVHFLHMIPDEIEGLKRGGGVERVQQAEERQEAECALAAAADLVAAVGPRIHDWFLRDLQARGYDPERVHCFVPGFDLGDGTRREPPLGRPWMTLVLGRAEDRRLKGLDLAARAFSIMRGRRFHDEPSTELLVRGAPPGTGERLAGRMRRWSADPGLPVRVRTFSTRTERLSADLLSASLLIMPSRAEGFGLVGAESIAAGTPTLVSGASGLGDLLRHEVLRPAEAARTVVPVTGDDAADAAEWSRQIGAVLRDREGAFAWAGELRDRLAERFTWPEAVSDLLARLDRVGGR